jgi:HD-GYP domain-containing protein (c-di-GMP phosphodiesterase class II)
MRRHSEIGGGMLKGALLQDVAEWVLAHHERPDGQGYPRGLAGDEIPIEARILSVADSYEAMIADRSYRRGIGHEAARAELIAGRGGQFDAAVVDVFLEAFERPRADESQPWESPLVGYEGGRVARTRPGPAGNRASS